MPAPVLFVYVDNSNIWIEGQRLSAVRKGQARDPSDAMNRKVVDRGWSYDFGRLYELACPPDALVGRSKLWGSRPPPNDSVWRRAEDQGFQVEVYDRNAANKEKRVDVAIATEMVADSFRYMNADRGDMSVLVGGDQDFMPAFELLRSRGLRTRVVCWRHSTSVDLRSFADEYIELDPHFDFLTKQGSPAMPGPEAL